MTNLQLVLTISIPSLLILVGIFLDNAGFNSIETRLATIDERLRQFYRDLGRHEAEIVNIKERNRS
jgi:low affinity Fe/Cu permease